MVRIEDEFDDTRRWQRREPLLQSRNGQIEGVVAQRIVMQVQTLQIRQRQVARTNHDRVSDNCAVRAGHDIHIRLVRLRKIAHRNGDRTARRAGSERAQQLEWPAADRRVVRRLEALVDRTLRLARVSLDEIERVGRLSVVRMPRREDIERTARQIRERPSRRAHRAIADELPPIVAPKRRRHGLLSSGPVVFRRCAEIGIARRWIAVVDHERSGQRTDVRDVVARQVQHFERRQLGQRTDVDQRVVRQTEILQRWFRQSDQAADVAESAGPQDARWHEREAGLTGRLIGQLECPEGRVVGEVREVIHAQVVIARRQVDTADTAVNQRISEAVIVDDPLTINE